MNADATDPVFNSQEPFYFPTEPRDFFNPFRLTSRKNSVEPTTHVDFDDYILKQFPLRNSFDEVQFRGRLNSTHR